jgi:predicted metal-dependent hydrolase
MDKEMMKMVEEMRNLKRTLSKYHKRDYHYTMDELDLFIEEFMALQNGTNKLTPLEARLLMQQVYISFNVSKERKLPIETRYYGELLSKLIKSYGH